MNVFKRLAISFQLAYLDSLIYRLLAVQRGTGLLTVRGLSDDEVDKIEPLAKRLGRCPGSEVHDAIAAHKLARGVKREPMGDEPR